MKKKSHATCKSHTNPIQFWELCTICWHSIVCFRFEKKKRRNEWEKHVLRTQFSSANAGNSLRCESDKYVAQSSRTANKFVKQIRVVEGGRECSWEEKRRRKIQT